MTDTTTTETPAFPKVLVRVRRTDAGLVADIREVGDADAEAAGTAEGYVAVDVPASAFPAYPKWVYHADGHRQIVQSEAELEKLGDGYTDAPVEKAPEPAPAA